MEILIPPILLNCWKHHAGFIRSQIHSLSVQKEKAFEQLNKHLLQVGDSLMDLYLGSLTPQKIANYILEELKQKEISDSLSYQNWLYKEGNQYRITSLPDNSKWTLRYGKDENYYVHIHPARYSPKTIRVRSLSLKTAIAVLLSAEVYGSSPLEVSVINKIRVNMLNASPINKISSGNGLGKLILILKLENYI
jgi:hypothetical protein